MSNPFQWFDYFDKDRSGFLDREEVVNALQQTFGGNVQTIRQTVYNVWGAFDHNNSGSIDRGEFCAPSRGMADTLLPMMQQQQHQPCVPSPSAHQPYIPSPSAPVQMGAAPASSTSTWACMQCNFMNFSDKRDCAACGAPRPFVSGGGGGPAYGGGGHYAAPVAVATQGMSAPTYSNQQQYAAPVVVQGTVISPSSLSHSSTSFVHHTAGSSASRPFQAYERYTAQPYQAPPLGMQSVPTSLSSTLIPVSGRRKALLIGINYTGSRAQLRGCQNDANNIQSLLFQNGYPNDSSHCVKLIDDR
ncbi:MAG: EF-hand domain-containing protein, partial [Gaiellaceae bacterium]